MPSVFWTAPVSLLLAALLFPPYIKWLKSKQIEQYIREEGPQSHAGKAKTPTMGGLCFIAVSFVVAAAFLAMVDADGLIGQKFLAACNLGKEVAPGGNGFVRAAASKIPAICVLVIAVLCGLIGFADDYSKVTSRSNKGLSAKLRLLIEFGLGATLSAVLIFLDAVPSALIGFGFCLPLDGLNRALYLWLMVPFLVAATTNAVNLHDGMDGLAGGTSVLVLLCLTVMLAVTGSPYLAMIAGALAGAITGFLLYNRWPAKIFMGDTGSLFIGGTMACLVAASGLLVWFVPLALIYVLEALSVMAQVVYFKLTKPYTPPSAMPYPALVWTKLTKRLPGDGKRLLRMAPLHHHFEAVAADAGKPEWLVVSQFWLAQALLCGATMVLFKLLWL